MVEKREDQKFKHVEKLIDLAEETNEGMKKQTSILPSLEFTPIPPGNIPDIEQKPSD